MAAPQAELESILKSQEYKLIVTKNVSNPNYKFKSITPYQDSQAITLVSLLDYYNIYKNNISRNIKIKILQTASSYIQQLLTSLGSTPTPGINNSSRTIRPGQSDLTGLLTNAMTEVDTEMKTLLEKEKITKKSSDTIPPPAIIQFTDGICAGEGCFYTSDEFTDNITQLPLEIIDKISVNTIDVEDQIVIEDVSVFDSIANNPDISYKVFGKPNPNTKKIIQDLNDALGGKFNDKTTYRLESIDNIQNVYGFTIELKDGYTVNLNETHKGLKTLEVLFQYTCQEDLLTYFKNPKGKSPINVKEQFTSLFNTLIQLHEKGIVHLDIKLQNIMKCDNTFRFIDFAIGKLDENTEDFITTYHISTKSTLDFTEYMMIEWLNADVDRRYNLTDIALTIFKLTDLFCLLHTYISLTDSTQQFIKEKEDRKGSFIDMKSIYQYSIDNRKTDNLLQKFIESIDTLVTKFEKYDLAVLKLESSKLEDIKTLKYVPASEGISGGKLKKKKQKGGVNTELIDTIKIRIKAQGLSISDENLETDIKNLLKSIPEDFQNNNQDIVENFITFRYLSNHYIPTKIETEEDFNTKLNYISTMNELIKDVVSTISKKEATYAATQEEAIATSINTRQNTRNSNISVSSNKNQLIKALENTRSTTPKKEYIELSETPTLLINPFEGNTTSEKINSSTKEEKSISNLTKSNKIKTKDSISEDIIKELQQIQEAAIQYPNELDESLKEKYNKFQNVYYSPTEEYSIKEYSKLSNFITEGLDELTKYRNIIMNLSTIDSNKYNIDSSIVKNYLERSIQILQKYQKDILKYKEDIDSYYTPTKESGDNIISGETLVNLRKLQNKNNLETLMKVIRKDLLENYKKFLKSYTSTNTNSYTKLNKDVIEILNNLSELADAINIILTKGINKPGFDIQNMNSIKSVIETQISEIKEYQKVILKEKQKRDSY